MGSSVGRQMTVVGRSGRRSEIVLKAANGEIIGRSERYKATPGMENGIESVKTNGPIAPTEDQT